VVSSVSIDRDRIVLRRALYVGLLIGLCKVVSAMKEASLAAWIGVGDPLDIYLTAFIVPTTVINIANTCLASSFIPQFQKLRLTGEENVHSFYSGVLVTNVFATAGLGAFLALGGPRMLALIAPGFPGWKVHAAGQCLLFLLPVITLSGLTLLWGAVLNSMKRFAVSQVAPSVTPLAILAMALLVRPQRDPAIFLALATTGGALLEATCVGLALKRTGFQLWPSAPAWGASTRLVLREFGYLASSNIAMAGVGIIQQAFAATCGSGGVATLSFGSKVPYMLTSATTMALGTVVLPHFANLAATHDWIGFRGTCLRYVIVSVCALIPFTVLMVALSPVTVRILFHRGAFTDADAATVARLQTMYFLQLPFTIPGLIGTRVLITLKRNRQLLLVGVMNLMVAGLITGWLVKMSGIAGIGLSSTLMYAIASCTVVYMAWSGLSSAVRTSACRAHAAFTY